jgi:hypothetical protein
MMACSEKLKLLFGCKMWILLMPAMMIVLFISGKLVTINSRSSKGFACIILGSRTEIYLDSADSHRLFIVGNDQFMNYIRFGKLWITFTAGHNVPPACKPPPLPPLR